MNWSNYCKIRVIHFADWNEKSVGEQFGRWLAYTICEAVRGRGTQRTTQMLMKITTQMPKWKKLMAKSGRWILLQSGK